MTIPLLRPHHSLSGFWTLILALSLATPLAAHDLWILPSSFRPPLDSALMVRLIVGDQFQGDPLPRDPHLIRRFVLVAPSGLETSLPGFARSDPAGFAPIRQPGLFLIAYRSNPYFVQLDANTFAKYVRNHELENIIGQWQSTHNGQVRENFSRCAKAMILVGPPSSNGYDRVLGLTLELVPEKNPHSLKPTDVLPVRLLYEGKPHPDTLIIARPRSAPAQTIRQRTDEDGRVFLTLPHPDVWLITALHLIPAEDPQKADWQSFWASLIFQLGD